MYRRFMTVNKKPHKKNMYGPGSEFALQKKCVEWLEIHYPDALFCATIGGELSHIQQRTRAVATGYRKGIPDLMIYNPSPTGKFRGFALEFKVGKNTATPEQIVWMERLTTQCKWKALVIREYGQFINEITNYFMDPMEIDG